MSLWKCRGWGILSCRKGCLSRLSYGRDTYVTGDMPIQAGWQHILLFEAHFTIITDFSIDSCGSQLSCQEERFVRKLLRVLPHCVLPLQLAEDVATLPIYSFERQKRSCRQHCTTNHIIQRNGEGVNLWRVCSVSTSRSLMPHTIIRRKALFAFPRWHCYSSYNERKICFK